MNPGMNYAPPFTRGREYLKIKRLVGRAIGDFDLVEENDRILVAMSGGKDSYTLLHILESLRRRAPVNFELVPVMIDPGYPGFCTDTVEKYLKECGFDCVVKKTSIYNIIEKNRDPGSSYCSFCSRLRRGVIYTMAQKSGCNKIALGHHLDDFIETLLLNQFYNGRLSAMSPKLYADDEDNIVIRPLVYVEEKDISAFAERNNFPIVHCRCPDLKGRDRKREKMKDLVKALAADNTSIRQNLLSAMGNVVPRHLLDRRLK